MKTLPEFKVGDKVTFMPYEVAHPHKIIKVEFTNRVPWSDDKCWLYTLDGARIVTTAKSIVESVHFEIYDGKDDGFNYVKVENGVKGTIDLNYASMTKRYNPAPVRIVADEMYKEERMRVGVEFLEDSTFIQEFWEKSSAYRVYKKGDVIFVSRTQITID